MTAERHIATAQLIDALRRLEVITAANIARSEEVQDRIRNVLARLEAGEDLPNIIESEPEPRIPTLITANIEALQDVGAGLRKIEAAALRAHGYTMRRIAELFGVSRQRVSALLKQQQAKELGRGPAGLAKRKALA